MANKKITELQLRSSVSSDLNLPSDDGTQSYRVTANQIKDFVLATGNVTTSALANASVTRIKSGVDLFNFNVATIAGATTLTSAHEIVLCNAVSAAFTVTLPTAVGLTGKCYRIKKTDTTFNAVTIDGAGSETIDLNLTRKLLTQNESLQIVSDGANWKILQRQIPSEYVSYTPTLGIVGGTPTTQAFWRRLGDSIEINFRIVYAGTATSGNFTLSLPLGLTIDTTKLTLTNHYSPFGFMQANDAGAVLYFCSIHYASSTTITAWSMDASIARLCLGTQINFNTPFAIGTTDVLAGNFRLPITDWEG